MKTYYYMATVRDENFQQVMVLESAELDEKKLERKGVYERVRVPARDSFGTTHRMVFRSELYEDKITVLDLIATREDEHAEALERQAVAAREQSNRAYQNLIAATKEQENG